MAVGFRAAWASVPSRRRGILLAVGALLIWSFWPVWTRHGVTKGLAPEDIVFLRFTVGGLIFLPFLAMRARMIPPRKWLIGFGLAVCQGAPFVLLMAIGLRFAPANHAASLATGASPIFASLLALVLFAEPIAKRRWLGMSLVLGGAGILAIANAGGQTATGHLFFLAAAAMAAIYIVSVARSGLTPFQAAAMVCVFSMVFYAPIYLIFGLGRLAEAPVGDIVVQGIYQGVFVAVVSFVLFNGAIARLGPAQVTAVGALLPVFTLLLAIPVLDEWPRPIEILCVILISTGVYFAAKGGRAPADASAASASVPAT